MMMDKLCGVCLNASTFDSRFSRVILGGLAASTARAIIETPLELAKVIWLSGLYDLKFVMRIILVLTGFFLEKLFPLNQ